LIWRPDRGRGNYSKLDTRIRPRRIEMSVSLTFPNLFKELSDIYTLLFLLRASAVSVNLF
jgi:hypothetical protein